MKFYMFVAFILISYVANSKGIYMDPDSLSFSDYKGQVDHSFGRSSRTYCGMSVGLETNNGIYNCKVYPIFFKDSSWIDFKHVPEEKLMDLFRFNCGPINLLP